MHFEVTNSTGGGSLQPFNSGLFYLTNTTSSLTSSVSQTTQTASGSVGVATTTSTPSNSAASNSSSGDKGALKIGLGVGLGIGIPLLLLVAVLASVSVIGKHKRRKEIAGDPGFNLEKKVLSPVEMPNEGAIFEAPNVVAEAPGKDIRYELSGQ
jgi:hypothetical protein